jgi:hypothetical protein
LRYGDLEGAIKALGDLLDQTTASNAAARTVTPHHAIGSAA